MAAYNGPKLSLTYFGLPGRGEAIRMAAKIGGIPMEDNRLGFDTWPELKPKTKTGQLPFLKVGDVEIAQSRAILRYIGKLAGLYPWDPLEAALVDEAMENLEDQAMKPIAGTMKMSPEEKLKARAELIKDGETIMTFFKKLDAQLAASPSGFLVGSSLTIADLEYFTILGFFYEGPFVDGVGDQQLLNKFANIQLFRHKIASTPTINAMYAGTTDGLRKCYTKAAISLWDRMGGEAKVRPLCNDLYDMHASDPLTAPWFGAHVEGNQRTADQVKENVFTFFSAGIGGGHEYGGRDMKAAHEHMNIDPHAFHALCNHVLVGMEKHRTGGKAEREEVWDILMSLQDDVMYGTSQKEKPAAEAPSASLWDRMGGEDKIRPLCNDLYNMHATDPLTAPWFGQHTTGNKRTAEEVKENVFTFFSAGIGGPHPYGGNDMKTAHLHMKIDKHAFHALTNHVLVGMEKHKTGGKGERNEVYDILMSLRPDVMHGTFSS
jgi:glutathione S-transferase/truncated hemoglobin YjbI